MPTHSIKLWIHYFQNKAGCNRDNGTTVQGKQSVSLNKVWCMIINISAPTSLAPSEFVNYSLSIPKVWTFNSVGYKLFKVRYFFVYLQNCFMRFISECNVVSTLDISAPF